MAVERFVQIRFKEQTEVGEFSDALYFKEGQVPSDPMIDAAIQSRVSNYVSLIKNPPPPVEPTKAQLEQAKSELQAQIVELDIKIAGSGK